MGEGGGGGEGGAVSAEEGVFGELRGDVYDDECEGAGGVLGADGLGARGYYGV